MSSIVILTWITCVQMIGLILFAAGFFLTRTELSTLSNCDPNSILLSINATHLWAGTGPDRAKGCWGPQHFDRTLLLVIDALRHDFIDPTTSSTAPFLGRFPIVGELQALEPWSTRRNKLEADPPTVTAQRLKAIATGTLPTFLDLRKNFASPSVAEDNWLAQLKSNRHAPNDKPPSVAPTELRRTKKPYGLGMLGDDTWEALFPGFFRPSAPMSSFNTRDLHSVDDEVLEKLPGYIKGDEWAVMIAHFLGVDHCGHTFGPNNNEMKSKLDQMDKMVRKTVDALRAEYGLNGTLGEKTNVADIPHVSTFVTLMGDHGMTALGNHGGASDEERFAGFFSWATPAAVSVHCYPAAIARCRASQLWNNVAGFDPFPNFKNRTEARVMAQIDIVPSISLLMGLPIPYSNFGGVSPELFTLPQVTQSFFEIEFAAAQSRTWEKFKCNEESNRLECAPIVFAVRWGRHPLSQALLVNSAQVWNYLSDYAQQVGIPLAEIKSLRRHLDKALYLHDVMTSFEQMQINVVSDDPVLFKSNEERTESAANELWLAYRLFLTESLELGRSLFTRFDGPLMFIGVFIYLGAATFLLLFLAEAEKLKSSKEAELLDEQLTLIIFRGVLLGFILGGVMYFSLKSFCANSMFVASAELSAVFSLFAASSLFISRFQQNRKSECSSSKFPTLWTVVVYCLLHSASRFSNSYVASEASVVVFLAVSCTLCFSFQVYNSCTCNKFLHFGISGVACAVIRAALPGSALRNTLSFDYISFPSWTLVPQLCILAAVDSLTVYALGPSIVNTSTHDFLGFLFHNVSSAFKKDRNKKYEQHLEMTLCILLWSAVAVTWFKEHDIAGNNAESKYQQACMENFQESFNDKISRGQVCASAIVQIVKMGAFDFFGFDARNIFPRFVYTASAARWIRVVFFTSPKDKADGSIHNCLNPTMGCDVVVVSRLLGLIRSALVLIPVYSLCLGPGGGTIILAMYAHIACLSYFSTCAFTATCSSEIMASSSKIRGLAACSSTESHPEISFQEYIPTNGVFVAVLCMWKLYSRHHFFASGHSNVFSDLQYGSSFVGFDSFWFPRAAFLLGLNTYGSEIIFVLLGLPIVLVAVVAVVGANAPRCRCCLSGTSVNLENSACSACSDLRLSCSKAVVERTCMVVLAIESADILSTLACVTLHRRHLMVWAIFAPKFVVDGLMHATFSCCLLVLRISNKR